ncbi:nucleotidyltransferase domain-containing protein [Rhodopila sp.]|jgi:hypothetical protein|uniref:nucleotidyltransferase domain-containing protein n=1 Tax=Rhodopila sp. TaxID=2480087 RepID=UPI0038D0DD93
MNRSVKHWDGPGVEAWCGAWTPAEVAQKLVGVEVPWCVVGGWAIDLFLGRQTRPHGDLEIAVARSDFPAIRACLDAYAFHAVKSGEVRALSPEEPLPAEVNQAWALDREAQLWRVDVMQEPGDRDTWVFRRDELITAPRRALVSSDAAIPHLRPEGVLLYKAKACRPKDEADFAACLPSLDSSARRWLAQAIEKSHPNHAWLAALV